MSELLDIFRRHGTDKADHRYDIAYGRFFGHRRQEPLKIVEIGILGGASLRAWQEYFPRARFWGIDINPDCRKHANERVQVMIGDQGDQQFLVEVAMILMKYRPDLIIDDGSHLQWHQQLTAHTLWPALAPGGCYAIEDLETAYNVHGKFNPERCTNTPEKLQELVIQLCKPHRVNVVPELYLAANICMMFKPVETESRLCPLGLPAVC